MLFGGKVEKVYFLAKGLVIIPIALWVYWQPVYVQHFEQFLTLVLAYALINLFLYQLSARGRVKEPNMLFALSLVDAAFLHLMVSYYGGADSQLHMPYYFLIAMLSVRLPARMIMAITCVFTASYLLAALTSIEQAALVSVGIKTLYLWLTAAIGSMIFHYLSISERKLLKTLDTLNERTWELESSQLMLENMYETTRTLTSILDLEQLLKEVLNIADDLLRARRCTVFLVDPSGESLAIYAEVIKHKKTLYDPPVSVSDLRLPQLEGADKQGTRRVSVTSNDSKIKLLELPLKSHGQVIGLLQIEPLKKGELSEKERKNFMVFANSTAVGVDNARMHMKMQELIVIDELTGLHNYRHFRNELADEIRRADRYQQQLSLLMIDVDHFKTFNDSQGHQTGNIILQEIADIIGHSVRDVDIVARFGGEEFMVILPQTNLEDALIIAERIRSQVEKAYFTNSKGQRDLKVTVSVGAVAYPGGVSSSSQLLEKVDQALYNAKNSGRNRVGIISPANQERAGETVR